MEPEYPQGSKRYLAYGSVAMIFSIFGMTGAILAAYIYADHLSLAQQIAGHLALPIFAAVFKLSYVVHLAAHHEMGTLNAG